MSALPGIDFQWSDEQLQVIEQSADAHLLVVADAGTGKTAVAIERLTRLVESERIAPGSEVLLLSFTRAAVGELKQRLASAGGAASYARVATFDSFATRLLFRHDPDGDWQESGYDGRIAAAIQLIDDEQGDARDEIGQYRHIFVDEIQDLVGIRADLVLTVIGVTGGGFTMLGDPAQAIYDWSDVGASGGLTVFDRGREAFSDSISEYILADNYRAETASAGVALPFGPMLRRPLVDYEGIYRGLRLELAKLPDLGSLAAAIGGLTAAEGTTAILCRTNGQALAISSELHTYGVRHRLQREATERAISPWLGRVLLGIEGLSLGESQLRDRVSRLADGEVDPDESWRILRRLGSSTGSTVDISRVRRRVMAGHVPDELTAQTPARLTVSTVHRAKGLEFDLVVVVDWGESTDLDGDDLANEVRTLYVAMTRPKKRIVSMPRTAMQRVRLDTKSHRWIRGGPKYWQTFGIEIKGNDSHRMHPAGSYLYKGDPMSIQRHIWEEVQSGDSLRLEFLRATVAGPAIGFYRIVHESEVVGVTSEAFGKALARRLGRDRHRDGRWPAGISDIHVESVDTVAGSEATSNNAGLGEAGIWLRVRPVGLGVFEW